MIRVCPDCSRPIAEIVGTLKVVRAWVAQGRDREQILALIDEQISPEPDSTPVPGPEGSLVRESEV